MLLRSTSYGKKKYHTICLFSIHLSLSRIKKNIHYRILERVKKIPKNADF